MVKKNFIVLRQEELIKTGLCKITDFDLETKTRFENYVFDFGMSEGAKNILKMARKELLLLDSQLERIERIAKAIIKAENRSIAEDSDLAEAIQYVVNQRKPLQSEL